jgi:hypothetical protein
MFGFAPVQSALAGSAAPAVALLLHTDEGRMHGAHDEEDLLLKRYWSILGGAAAGWATFVIAYCPWHLVPHSAMELGIVLFGAAAGGCGALVISLHPEEEAPALKQ